MPQETTKIFPMSVGKRERLVGYAVIFGVGIGVPLLVGVGLAIGLNEPVLLLFPTLFAGIFAGVLLFRPTGVTIARESLSIVRPVRSIRVDLSDIAHVENPASTPQGACIGIVRADGFFGSFGSYWNREWGRFRMYVTDHSNRVELRLRDGSRLLISPDDTVGFVQYLVQCARHVTTNQPSADQA